MAALPGVLPPTIGWGVHLSSALSREMFEAVVTAIQSIVHLPVFTCDLRTGAGREFGLLSVLVTMQRLLCHMDSSSFAASAVRSKLLLSTGQSRIVCVLPCVSVSPPHCLCCM